MSDQQIQEDQYAFPYHYIPRIENGVFYPSRDLFWGFRYMSNLESIINETEKLQFKNLLDLGCGDGRFIHELHLRNKNIKLTGIDTSKSALLFAKAFNPSAEFLNEDFPAGVKFDVVTLIEVIEHIDPNNLGEFIEKTIQMLNPEGTLIITVPSDNVPLIEKHFQHFNKKSIERLLETKLRIVEIKFLNRSSIITQIIQRLLNNRFYILNNKYLLKLIYDFYRKFYSLGKEGDCTQIMVTAKLR